MTWRPFVAALLLPVACTAVTLAGVARNRAGGREAIVLSEREVYASPRTGERSAATLWLSWRPSRSSSFDLRADRSLPREGFVALELDGPAFRAQTFPRESERDTASRWWSLPPIWMPTCSSGGTPTAALTSSPARPCIRCPASRRARRW
jgi:hypothetical protein